MSTADELRAYRRERLPWGFSLLALLLGCAAIASGDSGNESGTVATSVSSWLLASAAAWLLVAQFRLWDDLADREADRRFHPGRVLPGTVNVRGFTAAALTLGVVNVVVLSFREAALARIAIFAALCAVLGVWYLGFRRGANTPAPLAGAHVVLLKYPLIVLLASPSFGGRWLPRIATMLFVYALASAFEVLHDRSHRTNARARGVLMLDAALLATAVAIVLWTTTPVSAAVAEGSIVR